MLGVQMNFTRKKMEKLRIRTKQNKMYFTFLDCSHGVPLSMLF